jgi:hypothetical protein
MKEHLSYPVGELGNDYGHEVFVFHIPLDDKAGVPETSNDLFRRCRDVPRAKHPNQLILLRGLVGVRSHFADRLLREAE